MQQAYSLLPHLKITELLLEVDSWTGFTQHFKHLKSGEAAEDQHSAADRHSGRCHQSGPEQDGRVLPWHDLRQADLVAGVAHSRRNLLSRAGRAGQCAVPSAFRRLVGRRHHVIVGWPEFQSGRQRPSSPVR